MDNFQIKNQHQATAAASVAVVVAAVVAQIIVSYSTQAREGVMGHLRLQGLCWELKAAS